MSLSLLLGLAFGCDLLPASQGPSQEPKCGGGLGEWEERRGLQVY